MPIVDSHCDLSLSWYEPVEVLLFQMERNGVDIFGGTALRVFPLR